MFSAPLILSFPNDPNELLKLFPKLQPSPQLTSHIISSILPNLIDTIDDPSVYVSIIEQLPYLIQPHETNAIHVALSILHNHYKIAREYTVPILSVMQRLAHTSRTRKHVTELAIVSLKYCPEEDLPALCKTILRHSSMINTENDSNGRFKKKKWSSEGIRTRYSTYDFTEHNPENFNGKNDSNKDLDSLQTRKNIQSNETNSHLLNIRNAIQMIRSELQLVNNVNVIRLIVDDILLPIFRVNQFVYTEFQTQIEENGGTLSDFDILLLLVLLSVSFYNSQNILNIIDRFISNGGLTVNQMKKALERYREVIHLNSIELVATHLLYRGGLWPIQLIPHILSEYKHIRPKLFQALFVSLSDSKYSRQVAKALMKLAQENPYVIEDYTHLLEEALYEAHRSMPIDVVHKLCATLCYLIEVKGDSLLRHLFIFIRKQLFNSSERLQAIGLVLLSHLIHSTNTKNLRHDILQFLESTIRINSSQFVNTLGKMSQDMLCRHCFLFDLVNFNFHQDLIQENYKELLFKSYMEQLSNQLTFFKEIISEDSNREFLLHIASNTKNIFFDLKNHYSPEIKLWEYILNAINGYIRIYLNLSLMKCFPYSLKDMLQFGFYFPFNIMNIKGKSVKKQHLFVILSSYVVGVTLCRLSQMKMTFSLSLEDSQIYGHVLFCVYLRNVAENMFHDSDSVNIMKTIFFQHFFSTSVLCETLSWCYEDLRRYVKYCAQRLEIHPLHLEEMLLSQLLHAFSEREVSNSLIEIEIQHKADLRSFIPAEQSVELLDEDTIIKIHQSQITHQPAFILAMLKEMNRKSKRLLKEDYRNDETNSFELMIKCILSCFTILNYCAPMIRAEWSQHDKEEALSSCISIYKNLDNFEISFLILNFVNQLCFETQMRILPFTIGISMLTKSYKDYDNRITKAMKDRYQKTIISSSYFSELKSKMNETCNNIWNQVGSILQTPSLIEMTLLISIISCSDDDAAFIVESILLSWEDQLENIPNSKSIPETEKKSRQENSKLDISIPLNDWYPLLQKSTFETFFITLLCILTSVIQGAPLNLPDSFNRYFQNVDLFSFLVSLYVKSSNLSSNQLSKPQWALVLKCFMDILHTIEENTEVWFSLHSDLNTRMKMCDKVFELCCSLEDHLVIVRDQLPKRQKLQLQVQLSRLKGYTENIYVVFNRLKGEPISFLSKNGKVKIREFFEDTISSMDDLIECASWSRESHMDNEFFVLKKVWRDLQEEINWPNFHEKESLFTDKDSVLSFQSIQGKISSSKKRNIKSSNAPNRFEFQESRDQDYEMDDTSDSDNDIESLYSSTIGKTPTRRNWRRHTTHSNPMNMIQQRNYKGYDRSSDVSDVLSINSRREHQFRPHSSRPDSSKDYQPKQRRNYNYLLETEDTTNQTQRGFGNETRNLLLQSHNHTQITKDNSFDTFLAHDADHSPITIHNPISRVLSHNIQNSNDSSSEDSDYSPIQDSSDELSF